MLYLFDIDGTLIRSFLREKGADINSGVKEPVDLYDKIEVLPGRKERLEELRARGDEIALVTNQGGVAFGYQTLDQVARKFRGIWEALEVPIGPLSIMYFPMERPAECVTDKPIIYVAFAHPHAKIPQWKCEEGSDLYRWRKPGGGMILQAMADHDSTPGSTVFVGDLPTDEGAANAAGCWFAWADDFFSDDWWGSWGGPSKKRDAA